MQMEKEHFHQNLKQSITIPILIRILGVSGIQLRCRIMVSCCQINTQTFWKMGNRSGKDNVFLDSEAFITTATLGYNDFHFYRLEGLRNKSKYSKQTAGRRYSREKAARSHVVGRLGSVLEAPVRDRLRVYSENLKAKLNCDDDCNSAKTFALKHLQPRIYS